MSFTEDWEVREKKRWDAQYGGAIYLPQRQPDGTYSPGIGHTGSAWPRGRGHDHCWNPFNCISCGCGPHGPCTSHQNFARINGWNQAAAVSVPTQLDRIEGLLKRLLEAGSSA